MRPDRVVVGVESEHARQVLERLYRPLNLTQTPILFTSLETAELIKYATNSFLATKVTFINEMADLCERVGADVQAVARRARLSTGGSATSSCIPGPASAARAFPRTPPRCCGSPRRPTCALRIVESVVAVNEGRKRNMVRRIVQACGGSVRGMTIAILGVTFKPNTDDVRDSPSLVIVPALQAEGRDGARLRSRRAWTSARRELPDVAWCEDAYAAMDGADAMVILTEWNAFRGARSGAGARSAAAADRGRPAQRLRARRDDRGRLQLQQHRPAGAQPARAPRASEEDRMRRDRGRRAAIGSIRRILREYDIRGIVGETLSAADATALGRAYATMLRAHGGQRVCVGIDGRLSSPELAEAAGRRPARERRRGAVDRPRPDADAVLRGPSPRCRRRHPGHRLAQSAAPQRLQDDARQEVVLRRADPGAGPDRRRRRAYASGSGRRTDAPGVRRLCRRAWCRTIPRAVARCRWCGMPATAPPARR